jgi:hypothetical protein
MPTTAINTQNPTLLDLARITDPSGNYMRVVESLSQVSSVIADATTVEGNLPTGHVFAQRTGLPSVNWRRFNQGVTPSKSREDQITETCGMLAGRSEIDCGLAEVGGKANVAAYRLNRDMAFGQAFKNEIESAIFYASTKTDPEKLMGFAPRLASLTLGGYADQFIDYSSGEADSDQSSIFLVCWSPETIHLITPKGQPGGLKMTDMGEQLVEDSAGAKFRAYVMDMEWKLGLCVQDPRYLVRIGNIDTSAIVGTGTLLADAMTSAYWRLPNGPVGRPVFYMNRTVGEYLHKQARGMAQYTLTFDNISGMPVQRWMGIPIHITDSITIAEDVVT